MATNHLAVLSTRRPRIYLPVDGTVRARQKIARTLPRKNFKWKAIRLVWWGIAPISGTSLTKAFRVNLPVRVDRLLDLLQTDNTLPVNGLTVVVPSMVTDRKRIYLQHYSQGGDLIAYAKLGFGENEASFFKREVAALTRYNNNKEFAVPEILSQGRVPEIGSYLLTRPISPNFGAIPYRGTDTIERLRATIGAQPISEPFSTVASAWWFHLALERVNSLTRDVLETRFRGLRHVSVAPAHGDIGGENVFLGKNERLAILDWENFDLKAPRLTDDISHWIGLHHKLVAQYPDAAFAKFSVAFPQAKPDIILALLFQIAVGLTEAQTLLTKIVEKDIYENITSN